MDNAPFLLKALEGGKPMPRQTVLEWVLPICILWVGIGAAYLAGAYILFWGLLLLLVSLLLLLIQDIKRHRS